MRVFAKPMAIERLSLEARVLYSAFCAFLLIGLGSSAWLYVDDGLDFSTSATKRYYLGEAPHAVQLPPVRGGDGPVLDLPSTASEGPSTPASLHLEKPARQVMETFHFHLFSVPICLLVVGHLFMMCSLRVRTKVSVLLCAAVATLVHLLAPLLVRFGSPRFAAVLPASALLLAATWAVLLLVPLVEMWRLPRSEEPGA